MSSNSILKDCTEDFAVRIMRLHNHLQTKREYIISKQIVRSGTSIGANFAESQGAQSEADYLSKLHISLKESKETEFWINVLHKANYLALDEYNSLKNDLNIIIGTLTKIIKNSKHKNPTP